MRARRAAAAGRRLATTLAADVDALLRHEARAARAALAPLTAPTAALARAAAALTPSLDETAPERVGAWLLYTRCERGGSPLLLRRRADGTGRESVLLDGGRAAAALRADALTSVKPSPCGTRVAVTADTGGDGRVGAVVRVADQAVVATLPAVASADWWGGGGLIVAETDADGRPAAACLVDDRGRNRRLVYEERDPGLTLFVGTSKDGAAAVLTSAAPAAASVRVITRQTPSPTLITPATPGHETFVEHWGRAGGLVALTNAPLVGDDASAGGGEPHALEYALASISPPPQPWRPLLPRRPGVAVADVDVFAGGVLAYERDTGTGAPRATLVLPPARPADLPAAIRVPLPPHATVLRGGANADPAAATARVVAAGPLAADAPVDVCLASGKVTSVPRPESAERAAAAVADAVAAAGLALTQVTVGDDVKIWVVAPTSVAAPTSAANPSPIMLTVYGAYGAPFADPDFDPVKLALAARHGWRLAWAAVRGGGERGRGWHAAGRGARRSAAFADADAALTWARDASGGRVAIVTESAGALLACRLIAERPGDVAAAVLRAPAVDLTAVDAFSASEDGEFGPPGADLAAVSPLHLVSTPSTRAAASAHRGPPVLIQVARGDARATAAAAARWAAALRDARGPGGAPVITHVLEGGWHATPGGEAGRDLDAQAAAWCVAAVEGRL